MLTPSDLKKIKKLLENFATKEDLKQFATKNDLENFATKEDLDQETRDLFDLIEAFRKELKDDVITFKDEILREIVKLREDMIVVSGYSDRIENHEGRIEKLENTIFQ